MIVKACKEIVDKVERLSKAIYEGRCVSYRSFVDVLPQRCHCLQIRVEVTLNRKHLKTVEKREAASLAGRFANWFAGGFLYRFFPFKEKVSTSELWLFSQSEKCFDGMSPAKFDVAVRYFEWDEDSVDLEGFEVAFERQIGVIDVRELLFPEFLDFPDPPNGCGYSCSLKVKYERNWLK